MLDYCGEIDIYPMDGDNDNYNSYTPNISGAEVLLNRKFTSDAMQGRKDDFVKNPNYYHSWQDVDQIIERDTCYSVRIEDTWMNIPKKIVRNINKTKMFVHTNTFWDIQNKVVEKFK